MSIKKFAIGLAVVSIMLVMLSLTKKAKFDFTGDVSFSDTVKIKSTAILQDSTKTFERHAPYHYDTFQVSRGYLALDTSVTTDSMWLKFPLSPRNGDEFYVSSVSAVTKVFYISTPTVNNANTAFTAGQVVGFTYLSSPNKWYRRL